MEKKSLLDLDHLTEIEQTIILNVLLRDAELRNREEGRISKLKQKESDPIQLRFLTGTWFDEVQAKRHQSRAVDVVQNTIQRKRKGKVMSVFEDQKQQQTSDRQEDSAEGDRADLENAEILDVETKVKEEIKESPNPSVAPEPRPRTKLAKTAKKKEEVLENVTDVKTEESLLQNTTTSLQADSEGDIDSGSTELDYTRYGSVNNLQSNHMMGGSLMSLYSVGDFGSVTVTGQIQLSLHYDTKKEELHVQVCCCQDLAPARNSRSDPYVKVYLLPDNTSRSKRKTSVKRKTLNPVYNETLKYKVRKLDLLARVLSVSVWHMERVRRNLFMGEVEVQLNQCDWSQSQPTWYPLQPRVQINPDAIISRGTILVSLKYLPPGSEEGGFPLTGELHIWLKEIVGLLPPSKRGTLNIYVKSVVLPDESGFSGQRTRAVRGLVSPVFNHTMVYDGLQPSDLTQACTEITVWNSSSCIGGVRLSTGSGVSYGQEVCWMDSTEEETSVWNTVIQHPNKWVDSTLPIRTNLQLCSE
ncbi:synaptotagmin-like protein 1 isoform X2 [Trichomycterus rosablanca]|uniref:synaptotagmin-like protein 1 isoform X2 n=1 Tax=Trichomycterus rosablanca TaxID=2290929 RepID=UPI002F3533E8